MYTFRTSLRPIGLFLPEFAHVAADLSAIADLLVNVQFCVTLVNHVNSGNDFVMMTAP